MRETKLRRMQRLPGEGVEAGLRRRGKPRGLALESCRVKGIAQHGMTHMGHVDANLMGATRLQTAGNKARLVGETFNDPPMGHRVAAAPGRHDRDLFAVCGMAGERGVDGA